LATLDHAESVIVVTPRLNLEGKTLVNVHH
jgi:hypothetical protein